MSDNGLSYLKAIGIRVYTVRYQKIRKRVVQKDDTAHNDDANDNVSSRELKRRKGIYFCTSLLLWSSQIYSSNDLVSSQSPIASQLQNKGGKTHQTKS